MFKFRKAKKDTLYAPVTGRMIPLEEVPDKVFSSGVMGAGAGFEPETGEICAPCSGKITMIADTLHAFSIETESGAEILIHIGLDTVNLGGEGFEKLAEEEQKVTRGTPVIRVNLSLMKQKGMVLTTPMVVTNSDEIGTEVLSAAAVTAGETEVLVCEKK